MDYFRVARTRRQAPVKRRTYTSDPTSTLICWQSLEVLVCKTKCWQCSATSSPTSFLEQSSCSSDCTPAASQRCAAEAASAPSFGWEFGARPGYKWTTTSVLPNFSGKFECIGQGRSAWCKKAELSEQADSENTKEAPP